MIESPLTAAAADPGLRDEQLLHHVSNRVAGGRPELGRDVVEAMVRRCRADLDGAVHPEALPELLERLVLQRLANHDSDDRLHQNAGDTCGTRNKESRT